MVSPRRPPAAGRHVSYRVREQIVQDAPGHIGVDYGSGCRRFNRDGDVAGRGFAAEPNSLGQKRLQLQADRIRLGAAASSPGARRRDRRAGCPRASASAWRHASSPANAFSIVLRISWAIPATTRPSPARRSAAATSAASASDSRRAAANRSRASFSASIMRSNSLSPVRATGSEAPRPHSISLASQADMPSNEIWREDHPCRPTTLFLPEERLPVSAGRFPAGPVEYRSCPATD